MKKIVRLLVSILLLGWIAWQTDWMQVGQAFSRLRLDLWFGAIGLLVLAQLVSTWRWQQLARPLGFDRPWRHMVGFYFIGMYFNLLLPTSVGGDVVRAFYLDGRSGRKLPAFVSVFLDRLCGLGLLLALALVGLLLCPLELPTWIRGTVLGTTGAGLLGMAALPIMVRHSAWAPGKVRRALESLRDLPSLEFLQGPLVLSLFVQVANIYLVYLLGEAIGAGVPATYYWILVPMVSLLTLLPISVNGMGVREGAMAVLLAPVGIAQETALTLAFLWFAVSALVSLLGGLVYLLGDFPCPELPQNGNHEQRGDYGPIRGNPDQGRTGQYKAAA